MWKRLRPVKDHIPLVDGKTYKVRMACCVDENDETQYGEFVCVWRQGLKLWIEKDTYEVYEWADMDDVWEE